MNEYLKSYYVNQPQNKIKRPRSILYFSAVFLFFMSKSNTAILNLIF